MKSVSLGLALLQLILLVNALVPIELKGSRFIRPSASDASDDEEFVIIGVDYQPGGSSAYNPDTKKDVLSDASVCARDVALLQNLGINTIRVYTINPDVSHDECMSILNAAGIYVILDVNSPLDNESLNRAKPQSSYNSQYLTRIFSVIEAFKNYPNVLGFFSGNEVINDDDSATSCPPYIRAIQRDMKNYISLHSNRTIPVGYSAADVDAIRDAGWEYFQCNTTNNDNSNSDFYAINSYAWCSGSTTWTTSGFNNLNSTFSNTSIPLFFSEYGCIKNTPRTFTEVNDAFYTINGLLNTFSGGLVYEYSNEANGYGLVDIDESSGTVTQRQDFTNLKNAYANISFTPRKASQIEALSLPSCDDVASKASGIFSSFNTSLDLPPCPAPELLKYGVNISYTPQIVSLSSSDTENTYTIYNVQTSAIPSVSVSVNSDNLVDVAAPNHRAVTARTGSTLQARSSSSTSSHTKSSSSQTISSSSSESSSSSSSVSSTSTHKSNSTPSFVFSYSGFYTPLVLTIISFTFPILFL